MLDNFVCWQALKSARHHVHKQHVPAQSKRWVTESSRTKHKQGGRVTPINCAEDRDIWHPELGRLKGNWPLATDRALKGARDTEDGGGGVQKKSVIPAASASIT